MTNEELITDLKQFITSTVSQQMADVATKDDLKNLATKDDIKLLDEKIDLLQDAVAESLTRTDTIVKDHERRLGRLERRAA